VVRRAESDLRRQALDEARGSGKAEVRIADDVVAEIAARAREADVLVLGMQRDRRRERVFNQRILDIALATSCPLLMISQRA
jgi:hypothetical protein